MDKEHANYLLNIFGHPVVKRKGKIIGFFRYDSKTVARIEKMTNEELINDWLNIVWVCYGHGCIGVSDIQYRYLLEAEMRDRKGIDWGELNAEWNEALKR